MAAEMQENHGWMRTLHFKKTHRAASEDYGYSPLLVMEALNLFHRLVPGRQRRYRLRSKENVNRSMDSILDRLDGSKRRATYPNSEVNISLPFSIMPKAVS